MMVERIGEQYRCPVCFAGLGTPNTPVEQMEMIKSRHNGSKKCEETRKIIQYALGAQSDQRMKKASAEEISEGQNVIIKEVAPGDEPELKEIVVFESPTRFLRIRLKRSRTIWSQDGRQLDYIPAIYAMFKDGIFRTRDPWMVNSLRIQPNNVELLERRGIKGTNLFMRKDRFYEVGALRSRTA